MDRRTFHHTLLVAIAGGPFVPERSGAVLRRLQQPRVNGDRLAASIARLAQIGRTSEGATSRVAYSEADREGREYVIGLMRAARLTVSIDAAGNILGRRNGNTASLPPLMMGSHIDTVPGGGNYDGVVGSLGAIEVAHTLAEVGIALRHPLEVIIFQNEENGKVGSRAVRGEDPASYLDLLTHSGRTVREGIRSIGGNPERLGDAKRAAGSIAAFLELHIEQGGPLDPGGIDIGVVEGIVGIRRFEVTVDGFANHAGTTPMDQRRDAMLAAARFVDAVNRVARSTPGRHVATVGQIRAEPGAVNVIAGRVVLTLEIRDLELATIDRLFERVRAEATAIGEATGTRFALEPYYLSMPARCDQEIRAIIERSARALGLSTASVPSGAGHDAQEIAQLAPIGMIFVPSVGASSHSPEEFSTPAAIAAGADVLLRTLLALDAR
ncbi:MAG: Zn-dependent hydrolase [Gemmatimonadetes bacterium]|nr:Zn-dependent hydrolase [Gemmatimonadota bacterium]